ncbi:MAG: RING finger domain protein [Satyrvirus sp.]|uniref:RING finger domain protein n=1 Tax=Satyrvirus sp. TaxID=2487771 RepID=A0A3G5AJH7_9VIRU|nr:MAG: RING finger domain protein [Satyrvirus sp.]
MTTSDMLDYLKLFLWMHTPFTIKDRDTVQFVLQTGKKLAIPKNLIAVKLKSYLKNNNMVCDMVDNIDFQKVDDISYQNDNLVNHEVIIIIKMVNNHFSSLQSVCNHKGYPIPDPIMGRPIINWCECYHSMCHEKFENPNDLIQHLLLHYAYIRNHHKDHLPFVLCLTRQQVIDSKQTICPSPTCGKLFSTPEDLCDHFSILGIEPFWKQNMVFTTNENSLNRFSDPYKKIYKFEECMICFGAKPCVILYPCFHCIFCLNCYDKVNKCPLCKQNIENCFPF